MTSAILPGAEPWSHVGDGDRGAVVLHGFTGNPSSMRGVAEALAAKGFHVELPRLPGHGTVVDDMLATRWADWAGEAEAAYQRLGERASRIVVVGLSMGGALALRVGADHAEIDGLVCINPVAQPQTPEIVEMLRGLVASGTTVLPGIGSDIADPNAKESAYEGTPIEPLLSMLLDGIEPLSRVYSDIHIPLLLMNSPQDHVVEPVHSEFLADRYGGPVQRITLERSYHVATQDYDKELIVEATAEFATRVVAGR
ncbi:MAG TPA: alpha/beta fold hydrolase [Ilumatobacteraceae bacterium]|nr:alpha/beta fold hydrolase [Ilumatobacteraceae bacterium]